MNEQQFRDIYCNLMEEVKRRISVLSSVIDGKVPLPVIVGYELCFLQLRMICELIALGCAAAHGDLLKISKDLSKAYHPDKIIRKLESLHPEFYPYPTRQVINPITRKVEKTEAFDGPFLTKRDLLSLYGECGDVCHRGSMKKIVSGKSLPEPNFERVVYWREMVINLLNHHQIQLVKPDMMFWVLMHGEDGAVHGALMQRL